MAGYLCALGLLGVISGCHTARKETSGLPSRHTVKSDQLRVQSNFKLPEDHALIQDLVLLRKQLSQTLHLPLQTEPVVVYLFETELEYYKYLQAAHPGLPPRRAYFIATPRELAVYTYWGDRIQEDLRHEYTHGLLHAALDEVPLWLDEGLAEYFEVAGPLPGDVNPEYVERLGQAAANGWQPDLPRLEQLEKVEQMQRADYREAWAWVHFMLESGSPDARDHLLAYLQELRTNPKPEALSVRLNRDLPAVNGRMISYVTSLNTTRSPTATPVSVRSE